MLIAKLEKVAQKVGVKFTKAGTHYAKILRTVRTPNDYGGEESTSTEESIEYPAVLVYPTSGVSRSIPITAGQEYSDATVWLPALYEGEWVDVRTTDKLRVFWVEGEEIDRTFQVKRVKPHGESSLEIDVITE